jgi:plasmid stability protein
LRGLQAWPENENDAYNAIIAINWSAMMGSITVRNLDESVKNGLRLRAARHGWSMEQEVRQILLQSVATAQEEERSFAERVNSRFVGLHAEDLKISERKGARTPPDLSNL